MVDRLSGLFEGVPLLSDRTITESPVFWGFVE